MEKLHPLPMKKQLATIVWKEITVMPLHQHTANLAKVEALVISHQLPNAIFAPWEHSITKHRIHIV